MAKKRSKPAPHIVENTQQAEGALAELASIARKIQALEIEQQEAIDLAKAQASQACTPLFTRQKELENGLAVFAHLNKKELFIKGKSLDLGFGIIGFRASQEIAQMKNIKAEITIQKLKEFNFLDGIKTTETVNRSAMTEWSEEKLETVGLERKQKDAFFVEIKQDDVANTAL